jgi:hypothetical protein
MISNLPIVTKFIGSFSFGTAVSVLYFGMVSINLPTVLTSSVKTVGDSFATLLGLQENKKTEYIRNKYFIYFFLIN